MLGQFESGSESRQIQIAMEKQIFTIGYTIPTFDKNYVDFYDGASLMDADILLISPESLYPRGGWIEFSSGGGCYNAPRWVRSSWGSGLAKRLCCA